MSGRPTTMNENPGSAGVSPARGGRDVRAPIYEGDFSMEMIVDFPGGARVDAHFGPFTVPTDQPPRSSAPTPFALFLASIGMALK